MKLIPPSQLSLGLKGRWIKSPSNPSSSRPASISASWASASLHFCFTGSHLALRVGENTERKDEINGGTKMITISKSTNDVEEATAVLDRGGWTTVDPQPGSDLTIHDEGFVESLWIKIVLTDWASTFELTGLNVDDNAIIQFPYPAHPAVPRVLVIGDSISVAYAAPEGPRGEAVPFGVLDAFPFVAQRRLLQETESLLLSAIEVELRSYPGWLLVSPNADDIEGKFPAVGMSEGFSWDTPWSKKDAPEDLRTAIVIFAMGTNDQFFGISPSRFYEALRDLTAKLVKLAPLYEVWVVPPFPDCNTENTELVNAVPGLVERLQGDFGNLSVKLCDLVKGLGEGDTTDGVHLTLQAHKVVGERLAEFIKENVS